MKTSNILVIGDTHGRWELLNKHIFNENINVDIILQVGDFGFWPGLPKCNLSRINNGDTKIYFCDGNHEDFHALNSLENNEVSENIFYMKRGSTLKLPDGRNVLFMGGAHSIDMEWRTPGFDWFPEETIHDKDMENLPEEKIDILISHTCSTELYGNMAGAYNIYDPSRFYLSKIIELYSPKLWFFGHWHRYNEGVLHDTKWTCLTGIEQFEDSNSCRYI